MNVIGMSTGALYPDYATEEALDIAAQMGYSVVEVYLQTHGEYAPDFVTQLRERLDALGLAAHSVHNDIRHFDLWSPYTRRATEARDLFNRLIELAAELGAQAITWHGICERLTTNVPYEAFIERTGQLAEQAQAAGVTLTLENVSWCFLRTVAHIHRVRAERLPLGFTFDPFQAAEADESPTAIMRAMGDQLTTVHLSDYGADGGRHQPMGEGVIDWPPVFETLAALDYQGPLIVEVPYRGDLNVLRRAHAFVSRALGESHAGT